MRSRAKVFNVLNKSAAKAALNFIPTGLSYRIPSPKQMKVKCSDIFYLSKQKQVQQIYCGGGGHLLTSFSSMFIASADKKASTLLSSSNNLPHNGLDPLLIPRL